MRLLKVLLIAVGAVVASVEPAFAQGAEGTAASGLGLFGAAIGISIAALGGALGQGKVISAALESISRNPGAAGQMFLPWILALAFIESLVIFALIIALKLVGIF